MCSSDERERASEGNVRGAGVGSGSGSESRGTGAGSNNGSQNREIGTCTGSSGGNGIGSRGRGGYFCGGNASHSGRGTRGGKWKWLILLLTCIVFLLYGTVYLERVVKPNMITVGEMWARAAVNEVITQAAAEALSEEGALEGLLQVERSESGAITMVQASFAGTAQGVAMSHAIREEFSSLNRQEIRVPWGAILGSPLISQMNVNATMRVVPLGVAKVTLETDFGESGINQTNYRIYLNVSGQLRLLAPFSREEFTVGNQYLLAEIIIVGDVPESYVMVPYDEILDALNM